MARGSVAALLVIDHAASAGVRFSVKDTTILGASAVTLALVETGATDSRVLFLIGHGLLLPLLLAILVGLWANQGFVGQMLSSPLLQRAGKASLLLYFIHVPIAA